MGRFSIILPNEKQHTYRIIAVLISVMNIVGFAYFSIRFSETENSHYLSMLGCFAALPPLLRYVFFKPGMAMKSYLRYFYNNPKENLLKTLIISFIVSASVWMLVGMYFTGMLVLIFSVFGIVALRKLEMKFNDQFISFPSWPSKKINWNEVSNLILKDNILTIDLKNNKLIQFTIDESENENLNDQEFNTFIQQKLSSITHS